MPIPIDPTPEEIRKVCEQIQAGWTDDERLRRAGGSYIKPVFCLDKLHRIRGNHISQSDLIGEDC